MSAKTQEDIHVTKEDQERINTFAKYSIKVKDYKNELKEKKKELENFEELESEMLLLDSAIETVPYLVGDSYIYISPDQCQTKIENETKKVKESMVCLEEQISKATVEMNLLKKELYSKFKDNINLEEDL